MIQNKWNTLTMEQIREKVDATISVMLATVCFSFCFSAILILFHCLRFRYNLQLEKNRISHGDMWLISYQNHLKNLNIKSMIANFSFLVIVIEFANNLSILIDIILQFSDDKQSWTAVNHVRFISKYSLVPILCMIMQVLWLAYLHFEYKYTIMRWIAYTVLRLIFFNVIYQLRLNTASSIIEHSLFRSSERIILLSFDVFDLYTYIWYSRRFYQHLKSREIEAKLFMSAQKYLDNRIICRHYKIATIIVAIALSIYLLPNLIYPCVEIFQYTPQHDYYKDILVVWPIDICQLLYRALFNFNYLSLIYKHWKQKRNLKRVNDRIQPIVKRYHDKIQCYKHY